MRDMRGTFVKKAIEKPHVRYWDNKKSSEFLDMSGSFSSTLDKTFNYDHLENMSIRQ